MVHNNFRRQRRLESHLDETVRVASIVQKGIATGRSSYVEMRTLDRITNHNIKAQVSAIKKKAPNMSVELNDLLSKIAQTVSGGYTKVLTPNGIVRENELDSLLTIDADVVVCLGMIDPEKSQKTRDVLAALKDLIEERKKLVDSLKA